MTPVNGVQDSSTNKEVQQVCRKIADIDALWRTSGTYIGVPEDALASAFFAWRNRTMVDRESPWTA